MELLGIKKLVYQLRDKVKNTPPVKVVVGYTQEYAIFVHENMKARHPVGQAKFLEAPARALTSSGQLAKTVRDAVKLRGANMEQALLLAGLLLQRESQKLVPVDTGALKNSAFTRVEE